MIKEAVFTKELNIVIPDAKTITNGDVSFDCFRDFGNVTQYPLSAGGLFAKRVENADIVLCNKTPMNERTLKYAENLRYIGLFATGYNNIDLEYTNKRGITVCNAGGYSTDAVAQHTFALILSHCSRVSEYDAFVRSGGWKNAEVFSPFVYNMCELAGKTIGIVGLGTIGKAVAKIALAFGMKVLYASRSEKNMAGVERVTVEELVKRSDFVTVHCPLNSESAHMFDRELFSKFKKGAYFINTSRGGTVDEVALKWAVESGILSGAAVDVLDTEPMAQDCVLYDVENIVITPHIAWAPRETRERCVKMVYDNLRAFLDGKPQNVVGLSFN